MNLEQIFLEINKEEKDTINLSYYVIKYCKDKKIEITNLKLNKLLYFINILYMLKNDGVPIFKEEFLAWRHGPVLQSVYDKFYLGMILPSDLKMQKIVSDLSKDKKIIINEFLNKMASIDVWKLVEKTHIINGPWQKVYNDNKDNNGICRAKIPNKMIYDFYKEFANEI